MEHFQAKRKQEEEEELSFEARKLGMAKPSSKAEFQIEWWNSVWAWPS